MIDLGTYETLFLFGISGTVLGMTTILCWYKSRS